MCIFSVMSTTTSEKSVLVQFGSRTKVVKLSSLSPLQIIISLSFRSNPPLGTCKEEGEDKGFGIRIRPQVGEFDTQICQIPASPQRAPPGTNIDRCITIEALSGG